MIANKYGYYHCIDTDTNGATLERVQTLASFVVGKLNNDELLPLIRVYPSLIDYIDTQTPLMCHTAIQSDPLAIQFVKDQFLTSDICLSPRITHRDMLPLTFRFIKDEYRTPELCLEAVQVDYENLKYIEEQTPEICLAAVEACGWALQYVKEQTPEICLAALKQTCQALPFVKVPTTDMYLAAINNDSRNKTYVLDFVKRNADQMTKTILAMA